MNCVRCEIMRAKLRAIVMFNLGATIEEIVESLNIAYSGVYVAHWLAHGVEIRRSPSDKVEASVLIAFFKAERNLNDVFGCA